MKLLQTLLTEGPFDGKWIGVLFADNEVASVVGPFSDKLKAKQEMNSLVSELQDAKEGGPKWQIKITTLDTADRFLADYGQ